MAAGVRQVIIRFTGETKGLRKASGRAQKSMGGFKKALGGLAKAAKIGAIAVGAVAASAVAMAPKLLEQAASLELMANKATTVFEDQIGLVDKWAKKNATAMGLTSREATGLAANFADLLKPMGFTAKEATAMSTDVIGLSGALAEWSGGTRTAAEVSEALSAAMLGEREQLKSLGIAISQADVDARLAAKGQEALTGAAKEQAEAVATQELIFEKSTDAQEAFRKGGDSLARMLATGKARLREWAQELIVKLTPAIKATAKWVREHLQPAIARLAAWAQDKLVPALRKIADWVRTEGVPKLQQLWQFIQEKILPVMRELAEKWLAKAKEAFDSIRDTVENNRETLSQFFAGVRKVVEFIATKVAPIVGTVLVGAFKVLSITFKVAILQIKLLVAAWNLMWKVISTVVSGIRSAVGGAKDWIVGRFNDLVGFVKKLPGRIASAATGLWDGIKNAFRGALNWIIDKWNGLQFTVGPISMGPLGQLGPWTMGTPKLPRFHEGGVVPGPMGAEVPIMARAGETVLPTQNGPMVIENHIEIGGEVVRVVRHEVSLDRRDLKRRTRQRVGAFA